MIFSQRTRFVYDTFIRYNAEYQSSNILDQVVEVKNNFNHQKGQEDAETDADYQSLFVSKTTRSTVLKHSSSISDNL